MKKRIFYIVLPLLVGVLLGYHLRDLKSPPGSDKFPFHRSTPGGSHVG